MKSNQLEDHIDAPIKKCVAGLNLLGIRTLMSCCGFTYEGEKVPKKHLGKSYIYIDLSKTPPDKAETILNLSRFSSWTIKPINESQLDFYGDYWEKDHPWNDIDCPHYYEKFVLNINRLEKAIDRLSSLFLEEATIQDGNNDYANEYKIKYWQYKPTYPWIVTPEIYRNL